MQKNDVSGRGESEGIAEKFKSIQARLAKSKERFSAIEGERKVLQENLQKLSAQYFEKYEVRLDTAEQVSAEIAKVTADIATAESEFQRIYDEFDKIFNTAGA